MKAYKMERKSYTVYAYIRMLVHGMLLGTISSRTGFDIRRHQDTVTASIFHGQVQYKCW